MGEEMDKTEFGCGAWLALHVAARVADALWWRPRWLEAHFAAQGVRGPPYRLLLGSVREMVGLMAEASSKPMAPATSHNALPRVLAFYHFWRKIYGSRFLIWFGPTPRLTVAEPELVREIFLTLADAFDRYERQLEGDGLISVHGDKWAVHRRVLTDAFYSDNLNRLVPHVGNSVAALAEKWRAMAAAGGSGEVEVDMSRAPSSEQPNRVRDAPSQAIIEVKFFAQTPPVAKMFKKFYFRLFAVINFTRSASAPTLPLSGCIRPVPCPSSVGTSTTLVTSNPSGGCTARPSAAGSPQRRLHPPASARDDPAEGWLALELGLFAYCGGVIVGAVAEIKDTETLHSWGLKGEVVLGILAFGGIGSLGIGLMTAGYPGSPVNRRPRVSAFCARFSSILSTALFTMVASCKLFEGAGCVAGFSSAGVISSIMIVIWVRKESSAVGSVSNFWGLLWRRGEPAAAQSAELTSIQIQP